MPTDLKSHPEALPPSNKFLVIGEMEVTIQDFVAIWNDEDVLPELSANEIDTARKMGHTIKDHDYQPGEDLDLVKIFVPKFNENSALKLRIQKRENLRRLITRYQQSGQQRAILQMARVLAALSNNMRFDDVSAFIARFSEPRAEEVAIVLAASDEIDGIVEGNRRRTRYITKETTQPISSLPENDKQTIDRVLETTKTGHSIIPVILLERALAGHELTDDNCAELTLYQNIGSAPLIESIQQTRTLLMALGVISMVASFIFAAKSDRETFNLLMYGGFAAATVGALGHLIPTHALRGIHRRTASRQRYKAIYETICAKIQQLNQTPAGRVKVLFLNELIRSQHESDSKANLTLLQGFIELLERNPQMETDFNDTFSSMDRSWNDTSGVLEAIQDFSATRTELRDALSSPSRIVNDGIIDAEFEEIEDDAEIEEATGDVMKR